MKKPHFTPHHTALSVRDLEKSVAFYEKLGFKQVHRYDEEDGSMGIVHLKLGSVFLELFYFAKNNGSPTLEFEYANNLEEVGVKHIALEADDLEAALAWAKAEGLAEADREITYGRTKVSYFFIKDPDGAWVEFVKDDRFS